LAAGILFGWAMMAAPGASAGAPVTTCDRLIAHPEDPARPPAVAGVAEAGKSRRALAWAACRLARTGYPAEPRFAFQLARALPPGSERRGLIEWAAAHGHTLARRLLAEAADSGRRGAASGASPGEKRPAPKGGQLSGR